MTYYEKIISMDVDALAAFIYGVEATVEEELQRSMARQGVECTLVRQMPELRIADNVQRLLQEVEDGYT